MVVFIILLFVIGYLAITLEHPLSLDKTVPAIIMAALMWAFLAYGFNHGWFSIIDTHGHIYNISQGHEKAMEGLTNTLSHHFSKTAEILIFLIGAMTIVEIIDLHRGFDIIKNRIKTNSKLKLLWILGILAFFLSAIIDNLTTTIVIITLLRKLVQDRETRIWYASLTIIAANAGGAWSPIGDVTTTMLWIANKVSALGLAEYLIVPSLLCFAVPFGIVSFMKVFKGNTNDHLPKDDSYTERLLSSKSMLIVGIGGIVSVPIFKMVTGLPPYMGMMLALGLVWLFSEYVRPTDNFSKTDKHLYSAHKALTKIEFSSILFFLGILMSVASLETLVFGKLNGVETGTLRYAAESISNAIPNMDIVVVLLGMLSSVIDNVPLVAATLGMYTYELDHPIWHFIAYSAGTGGSMLIIGSAAGVAAMGMEKIDFIWYLKKITGLAFLGFIAGALAFIFIEHYIR
jgi:Na+/H+ antiporter NhaD/arsenite permease-like protein